MKDDVNLRSTTEDGLFALGDSIKINSKRAGWCLPTAAGAIGLGARGYRLSTRAIVAATCSLNNPCSAGGKETATGHRPGAVNGIVRSMLSVVHNPRSRRSYTQSREAGSIILLSQPWGRRNRMLRSRQACDLVSLTGLRNDSRMVKGHWSRVTRSVAAGGVLRLERAQADALPPRGRLGRHPRAVCRLTNSACVVQCLISTGQLLQPQGHGWVGCMKL